MHYVFITIHYIPGQLSKNSFLRRRRSQSQDSEGIQILLKIFKSFNPSGFNFKM